MARFDLGLSEQEILWITMPGLDHLLKRLAVQRKFQAQLAGAEMEEPAQPPQAQSGEARLAMWKQMAARQKAMAAKKR